MFWIICAALSAIAVVAVFLPFLRQRTQPAQPTAAYDLRVYRDQLREVGRDQERGVIEPVDAERLKIEIGRKVLEADRALQKAVRAGDGPGLALPAIALAAVTAGAFMLYDHIGAPRLPDAPIAARIAEAEARYAARPSQAEAEAQAEHPALPEPDPEYLALIERLRTAVADRPTDAQGLRLLVEHESRLGNTQAAQDAQRRLIAVLGNTATAAEHARLAALMIESAGGIITAQAESEIAAALQMDATDGHARYMLGLLNIQNGRPDRTFTVWASLLAEGPADAPWIAPIAEIIEELAWLAGEPGYQAPTPGAPAAALPGPDAAAIAAAEDMSDEDRSQMITGMVDNLMARLAAQGGSPEEWAQLIGALNVLDRGDQARAIWQEARHHFAEDPAALALVDAAATGAGLAE